ncbi:MAG: ribosomal protein [Anaerophaga sp.]|uniref:50S ribosomal protein L17 n=1 Tax=Anaerophaga thermohalophila TaxID=177400 RepID=UPI000492775E|nr:ribosomal protein [Anaerophaga sp.]
MRHRKKFNHLSRTSAHRKAMLSNMASSLIIHKRIKTTVAKAKALRMYVEPLINKSKTDNTHSRRVVFSHLQNKEAVSELFRDVSEKVANRPGGYTRILKLGNRLGDASEICYIELVDYNENMLSAKSDGDEKKRTRRGRRGGSKKSTGQPVAETKVDTPAETASAGVAAEDSSSPKASEENSEEVKNESAETTKEQAPDSEQEEKKEE